MRRLNQTGNWLALLSTLLFWVAILQAEELTDSKPKSEAEKSSSESTEENDEVNIPLAGHSEHGEAYNEGPRQNAYLMGGTGRVTFPVSTMNEQAQKFFDQGLGQLYGFWYYEAERSFRRVATLDPNCAMAYWGMAQANYENKERAAEFIAEAVEKQEQASERERMYIAAMNKLLTDKRPEKDIRRDYVKALEKIIRKFPDDVEAKAMLAVHLWQSARSGVPMNSHQAVESMLAEIFRVNPMHPAHHFRIHLWDREEPAQALESAAKCGQSAPTIAHMWHMPGHIYSRLKRYEDAVFQQEASARADHAHMMRDGVLPDQIHNYAHNNEWLIRNLVHLGRKDEALSLARNMLELPRHPKYNDFDIDGMCSCKYGRRRLLQVYESFELWDELLAEAETMYLEPTDVDEERAKRLRFIGVAHYHRGEFAQVSEALERLEAMLKSIDDKAKKAGEKAATEKEEELDEKEAEEQEKQDAESKGDEKEDDVKKNGESKSSEDAEADEKPSVKQNAKSKKEREAAEKKAKKRAEERKKKIDKARKDAEREAKKGRKAVERAIDELKGIQFLARGKTDEAIDKFKRSDIAKSRLARYYFLCGDHKKATEICEQAVKSGKNETLPLATQVDLLRRMGKRDEAREAFERLRTVAGTADLKSPMLAKLAKFAKELKYPEDWRIPTATKKDIGNRPELDSLGPFRWAPSTAVDWELEDNNGETVSLGELRGHPVVVIFYLGGGCLHCVEQLHEFAPMVEAFNEQNIEIVAISTETAEQISSALEDFSTEGALENFSDKSEFPIRLLANSKLDVFKKYRAYDDFEEMPLHGTFLIDAHGKIRWHDISYEPFMEPEYLLKEAQRILPKDKQE